MEQPTGTALVWLPLVLSVGGCQNAETPPAAGPDAERIAPTDREEAGDVAEAGDDVRREAFHLDPGYLTLLESEGEWLEERLCDVDGDGLEDNAVADLGSPLSHVFAMTVNAAMLGSIQEGEDRICAHFPVVEDRSTPSSRPTRLIFFEGADTDLDPTDDFSGAEPLYARERSLDGCGEPRFVFPAARIDGGALTAGSGPMPVRLSRHVIVLQVAELTGTIEPDGRSAELVSCGHVTFHEAGSVGTPPELGDLTALEGVLSGGAAMGMDTVPGLTPDLDLDGDGIEAFVLDDNHHIETCLDGDRTTIPGRDCWRDERMADGFSVSMRFAAVPAVFAGRAPGWDDDLDDSCPEGPPNESLFDPR